MPAVGHVASGLVVSPTGLTLYGIGKVSTKTVTVSEQGYSGTFTSTSTCSKVATISPATGKGPVFAPKLTAIAHGKCAFTFADGLGHKAVLNVVDKAGGSLFVSLLVPFRGPGIKHKHGTVRPHFISPSTQSMVVKIAGPNYSSKTVSGLTPQSSGCQLTLQGLQCTFGASLPPCPSGSDCYTADITTYDSYDAATNTIPTYSAPLSVSHSTFTIEDNQANAVTFNFSGVPASIVVIPGSALSNATGNIIDLVGPGPHKLLAEALDADNNLILGIGGPSYSVSSSGLLSVTLTQPAPGSPRFTVTPPSTLQSAGTIATLKVTAAFPSGSTDGCAVAGAVCSGAVTLDMQSLLAVSTGYSIELFAAEKGIGPLLSLTSGITAPLRDVHFDAKGNLYAVNYDNSAQTGAVLEFALGSTLPFRTIPLANPLKVATDPSGNLLVLSTGSNPNVSAYLPGATSPSVSFPVDAGPSDIVVDASDDIWVASTASGTVKYYANGGYPPVTLNGLVRPVGMALDPAHNTLYVSDQTHFTISQQKACGSDDTSNTYCAIYSYAQGSSTPVTFSSSSYGGNLAWVPGYGLYADNSTGAKLAFYYYNATPPVTPTAWTGGMSAGDGQGIAVDELGNVFVAAPYKGTVYGYLATALQGGGINVNAPPYVSLTNGLTYPYNVSIIP